MNPKQMGALVIDALEDIKAKNIVMINVSKLTSLFDYIVVASGDSNRQTRALANNVRDKLKEAGGKVYGSEGEETGEWVLVDLGDVVVHVMQQATREYYRLEELWRDGKIEFPKPVKETETGLPATVKVKARVVAKAKAKATAEQDAGESTVRKPAADKSLTRKSLTRKPVTRKPVTRKPAARKLTGAGKVNATSRAKTGGKTTATATAKAATESTVKKTPAATAKATGKVTAKARTSAKTTTKANTTTAASTTRRRTTMATPAGTKSKAK